MWALFIKEFIKTVMKKILEIEGVIFSF